jgi:hypothetical protein
VGQPCADYVETELAADRHDMAKKALKELMPDDASEVHTATGIELRRDKRGAVRFEVQGVGWNEPAIQALSRQID